MAGEPVVSVIVPVYNVESYLDRCLNSLVKQTLREIEIIVIDDGSCDGSGAICDRYSAADDRIRVIHKKNEGLAVARNEGVEASRGRFIMFVDADDWVEPDFCEVPSSLAIMNDAELVMFRHHWYFGGVEGTQHHNSYIEGRVSKETAMEMIHNSEVGWPAWNKCYARSIFETVRFPAGRMHEDIGFTYKAVNTASKIVYTNSVLYHYIAFREGSITASESKERLRDWLDMWAMERNDLKRWNYQKSDYFTDEAFDKLMKYEREEGLTRTFRKTMRSIMENTDGFTKEQIKLLKTYRFCPRRFHALCNSERWK